MKKRFLPLLMLVALLSLAASDLPLGRLIFVNRSGYPLVLRLIGTDPDDPKQMTDNYNYYLTVQKGEKGNPTVRTFNLPMIEYKITVTYIEIYDPVYGYQCSSQSANLDLTKTTQITFLTCNQRLSGRGDEYVFKFGNQLVRKKSSRRLVPTPIGTVTATPPTRTPIP